MEDIIIISVFAFGAVSIVVGNIIYFRVIIPTLEESGQKVIYSGLPTAQFKQWKEYKNICIERGQSLKFWKIQVISQIVAAIALLLWAILFILKI
ncbi:hypothetical protein ACFLZT_00335 [Thermodesulfobacteriota bacterium]